MAALYVPGRDPSRVYYGTDTRVQSLLVGAVVGILVFQHGPIRSLVARRAVRIAAAIGAALHALVVLADVRTDRRALPGRVPARGAGGVGRDRVGRAARPRRPGSCVVARAAAVGGPHLVRPLPVALAGVPDPHAHAHRSRRRRAPRRPTRGEHRVGDGFVLRARTADPPRHLPVAEAATRGAGGRRRAAGRGRGHHRRRWRLDRGDDHARAQRAGRTTGEGAAGAAHPGRGRGPEQGPAGGRLGRGHAGPRIPERRPRAQLLGVEPRSARLRVVLRRLGLPGWRARAGRRGRAIGAPRGPSRSTTSNPTSRSCSSAPGTSSTGRSTAKP